MPIRAIPPALVLAALTTAALAGPALAGRGGDGDLRVLYWQAPTAGTSYDVQLTWNVALGFGFICFGAFLIFHNFGNSAH